MNRTGEDLAWLHLTLVPIAVPAGVRVTGGRFDLGALSDGASAEGRVNLRIEPDAQPGPIKLELRVENSDGRTFSVLPVETTIA